jgi:N-glycosylase/DNA lyase
MEKLSLGNALSGCSWVELPAPASLTPVLLEETLLGGQAFRWFPTDAPDTWIGTWDSHAAALRIRKTGLLQAAILSPGTRVDDLVQYLAFDRLDAWHDRLPWRSDPVLNAVRKRWKGISLLRQSPEEALLAFICSSNKQILQIRKMVAALADAYGAPIPGTPFHRLPGWDRLAGTEEAGLRRCALGYRARHVAGTAALLAARPDYLPEVASLATDAARQALLELPGVGPKVADCVLLFGFGRAECFPVDTWIERILVTAYPGLDGWSRHQLATFGRIHFGPAAGLAQQWLFAEARHRSEATAPS